MEPAISLAEVHGGKGTRRRCFGPLGLFCNSCVCVCVCARPVSVSCRRSVAWVQTRQKIPKHVLPCKYLNTYIRYYTVQATGIGHFDKKKKKKGADGRGTRGRRKGAGCRREIPAARVRRPWCPTSARPNWEQGGLPIAARPLEALAVSGLFFFSFCFLFFSDLQSWPDPFIALTWDSGARLPDSCRDEAVGSAAADRWPAAPEAGSRLLCSPEPRGNAEC